MLHSQPTKYTESTTNDFRQPIPVSKMRSAIREKRLADLPPEMRALVDDIEDWVKRGARRSLISRFEFGVRLQAAYDDQTDCGRHVYGRDAMKILREVLPYQMTFIYDHIRFVQVYTPQEVEEMARVRMANGQKLSWSHVRILLRGDNPALRAELLRRTRAESWTTGQLTEERKKLYRDKPEKRGRHLARPKNLAEVIRQQATIADNFLKHVDKVWAVPEISLTGYVNNLPLAERNGELAQVLKDHEDKQRRVIKVYEALAEETKRARQTCKENMVEQEKEGVMPPADCVETVDDKSKDHTTKPTCDKTGISFDPANKPEADVGVTVDRSSVEKQSGVEDGGQLPGPRTAARNAKHKGHSARKQDKAVVQSREPDLAY